MDIVAGITILNIVLLLVLIYIYGDTYRKTKAIFTAGLIFFASFFLLQNIVAVYSYFTMSAFYAEGIFPFVLIMSIAQFIGLTILLKISL
jgi:hypothetical protein